MEYVCRSAWLYLIFSRISRTRATSVIYIPIVVEFIFAKKKEKKGNRRRDYKRGRKLSGNSLERFRNAFSRRLDRANVDSRKSLLERRLNTM